jgi:hypothetical protein
MQANSQYTSLQPTLSTTNTLTCNSFTAKLSEVARLVKLQKEEIPFPFPFLSFHFPALGRSKLWITPAIAS